MNNENIAPEKMQVFLERCYAQSNRLSRLLRDISVLTRMDEAANMIDMEKVDISMLVSNIVNEVSLELEQKQITVVNSLKPKIQLRGNYSLLYSIFRNLMDNAIAYAGTNIHINISCFREDENYYYFSFADTGIGVSPEHLNRLFERFYRVDKGRSRKLGGTGLGLAIVKNAVLIHGGTISAKTTKVEDWSLYSHWQREITARFTTPNKMLCIPLEKVLVASVACIGIFSPYRHDGLLKSP